MVPFMSCPVVHSVGDIDLSFVRKPHPAALGTRTTSPFLVNNAFA